MIRGVTIIIRLCVSRPIPTFLNRRFRYGSLLNSGTPNSLRPSLKRLMPPKSTVPPSGTLTVVVTDTNEKFGNCTVTPSVVVVVASVLAVESPPVPPELSLELVAPVVVEEPENVNSCTVPIWLNSGKTVSRTKRRSCEMMAWTVKAVPYERTVITGW